MSTPQDVAAAHRLARTMTTDGWDRVREEARAAWASGWSQVEIADACGVTKGQVWQWIHGR